MPTYPMFQAVPAGQTGPLVANSLCLLGSSEGSFLRLFSPLAKTEYQKAIFLQGKIRQKPKKFWVKKAGSKAGRSVMYATDSELTG